MNLRNLFVVGSKHIFRKKSFVHAFVFEIFDCVIVSDFVRAVVGILTGIVVPTDVGVVIRVFDGMLASPYVGSLV